MRGPLDGRPRRAWARAMLLLAAALALQALAPVGAQGVSADQVKATFLYKFALFVRWPDNAFASATGPLLLCIVGDDPFGPAFDRAAGAQRVEERTIEVRRLKTVTRATGCQILYIASSEAPRTAAILDSLHGASVLTVGDARSSVGSAPIVQFVVEGGRVRFAIDDEEAQRSGLAISSKLLGLAVAVRPQPPKE